jgi:uncharacterized protein YcsI (UPF0317 family)
MGLKFQWPVGCSFALDSGMRDGNLSYPSIPVDRICPMAVGNLHVRGTGVKQNTLVSLLRNNGQSPLENSRNDDSGP